MTLLKDIIQRCHKRHGQTLHQRKTMTTPALYKEIPYNLKAYCARRYPIMLDDLEQANISFMPIGRAPDNDRGPRDFGGDKFLTRQAARSWQPRRWFDSWGIQVYTGIPSEHNGAPWHDLHFTYKAICADPDAVLNCIEILVNSVVNPLLTLTKSGGLRFTCRIPYYLHPNTADAKSYIYKHTPTAENPNHRDVYLDILGENGYSQWDSRYEILIGDLLNPPVITKEVLFVPIDNLRATLHVPEPLGTKPLDTETQTAPVAPQSLNSQSPDPVTKEHISIRQGKLSPLVIKRSPILHKQEPENKIYETPEENAAHIQQVFQKDARILCITPEAFPDTNQAIESHLLNGGAICLNVPSQHSAETVEQRYQELNLPSFARWKTRLYRWEQVKDISVDDRIENPFKDGNVCEDPERCHALVEKGGDPLESICPSCPVYITCQERGFLSQSLALQSVKAQISPSDQLFINPKHTDTVEQILEPTDGTERICIIDQRKTEIEHLFITCSLSTKVLNEWSLNWEGGILGNFAKALLSAIEPYSRSVGNPITRIRAAIQAFQPHEEELIQQMCHLNVQGTVVKRGFVDPETGTELAQFSIVFEGGVSAYIPTDNSAAKKLKIKELPFFQPHTFVLNETMKIPMTMHQAIQLGILDAATVENIKQFPTVCQDPNWTFWHQLKHFFAHYKQDADAPMRCSRQGLTFMLPPILHPNVKRLLLISPVLSEQHLQRIFPDETIEFIHTEPSTWLANNQVFQIRTGTYPLSEFINFENNWDYSGLSKLGERFLGGIHNEIEKNTKVTHAIITYKTILTHLSDFVEKENVYYVKDFKDIFYSETTLAAPQVLWIVGAPHWAQPTMWRRAQMLFGNDVKPLYYDEKLDTHNYEDKRIQAVFQQSVTGLLTEIIKSAGLSQKTDMKVVLLTSLRLPGITDRPETLLFDWEDFEIAGGLDKLSEVIVTRERFEADYANLTGDSKRGEVERILGCSSRTANRLLQKLRGGNIQRVSVRDQILFLLGTGEKKTSLLVEAIDSSAQTIGNELKRLLNEGVIVRVRRGVYKLPDG